MSESWLKLHQELFTEDGKLTEAGQQAYAPGALVSRPDLRFPHVRVTTTTHELVKALEFSASQVGEARTGDETNDAYSKLTLARAGLYQRLQSLENRGSLEAQDVILRF